MLCYLGSISNQWEYIVNHFNFSKVFSLFVGAVLSTATLVSQAFMHSDPHQYGHWTGITIGAQGGWGSTDTDWRYDNANYFNTDGSLLLGKNFDDDEDGITGGGLLGYNLQFQHWLFGIEGTISAGDFTDKRPSPFFQNTDDFTTEIDWYSTIKVRVGYADRKSHFFVSGGWAGADVELTIRDTENFVQASDRQWLNGWVVGLGFEYKLNPCLVIGATYEYLKVDNDDETVSCRNCGSGIGFGTPRVDGDLAINVAMLRLVYQYHI